MESNERTDVRRARRPLGQPNFSFLPALGGHKITHYGYQAEKVCCLLGYNFGSGPLSFGWFAIWICGYVLIFARRIRKDLTFRIWGICNSSF
jgi:hypothetical protein